MTKVPIPSLLFLLVFVLNCYAKLGEISDKDTPKNVVKKGGKKQEILLTVKKFSTSTQEQQTKAREILRKAQAKDNISPVYQLKSKTNLKKKKSAAKVQEVLLLGINNTSSYNKTKNLASKSSYRNIGHEVAANSSKNEQSTILKKDNHNIDKVNKKQHELKNKTVSIKKQFSKKFDKMLMPITNVSDDYQIERLHAMKALIHSVILSTNPAASIPVMNIYKNKSTETLHTKPKKNNAELKESDLFIYHDNSNDIVTTTPNELRHHHLVLKDDKNFASKFFTNNKNTLNRTIMQTNFNPITDYSFGVMNKKPTLYDPLSTKLIQTKHGGANSFQFILHPVNKSVEYIAHKKEKTKAQDIIKSIEYKVSKMHGNEPAKPDRPEQETPKGLNLEKVGYKDYWERLEQERQRSSDRMKEKFEKLEKAMNDRMEDYKQRAEERRKERERKYEQEWGKKLYSRNSAVILENRGIDTPLFNKNDSLRETKCKLYNCSLLNNASAISFRNKKINVFSKYINSPVNHEEVELKKSSKLMISNEEDDEENNSKHKNEFDENVLLNQNIEVGALGDSHQWQIISEDSVVKEDMVNKQNKAPVKGSPRNGKKSKKINVNEDNFERKNHHKKLSNSSISKQENTSQYNMALHSNNIVLLKEAEDDTLFGTVFKEEPSSLSLREKASSKIEDFVKHETLKKRLDDTKEFLRNTKDIIHFRRNFICHPSKQRKTSKIILKGQNDPQRRIVQTGASSIEPFRRSEVLKDEKTIDINLVLPKAETPPPTSPASSTLKETQESLAELLQRTLDAQQKSSNSADVSSDKNMMSHMVSDLTRALDRQQMTNEINQITNTLAQTMMNTMLLNQRPQEKSSSIVDLEKEINSLKTRTAVPVESIDYEAAAVPSLSRILHKIKRKNKRLKKLIKKVKKANRLSTNSMLYMEPPSKLMQNQVPQFQTGGMFMSGGTAGVPQTVTQQTQPAIIPNIQQAPAPPPMIIQSPPQPQFISAPAPPPAPPPPPTTVLQVAQPAVVPQIQQDVQPAIIPQPAIVPQIQQDVQPAIVAQPAIIPQYQQNVQPAVVPQIEQDVQPAFVPQIPQDIQPAIVPQVQQVSVVPQKVVKQPVQYVPQPRPNVVQVAEPVIQTAEITNLPVETQPSVEVPDTQCQESQPPPPDIIQDIEQIPVTEEPIIESPVQPQVDAPEDRPTIFQASNLKPLRLSEGMLIPEEPLTAQDEMDQESEDGVEDGSEGRFQYNQPEYIPKLRQAKIGQQSINEPQNVQTDAMSSQDVQQPDLPPQRNWFKETYQQPEVLVSKYPRKQKARQQSSPYTFEDSEYASINNTGLYPTENSHLHRKKGSKLKLYPGHHPKKLQNGQGTNDGKLNTENQGGNNHKNLQNENGRNDDSRAPTGSSVNHHSAHLKKTKKGRHFYKKKSKSKNDNGNTSKVTPMKGAKPHKDGQPDEGQRDEGLTNSLNYENNYGQNEQTSSFDEKMDDQNDSDDFQEDAIINSAGPNFNYKTNDPIKTLMEIIKPSKHRKNSNSNGKGFSSRKFVERILLKTAIKANKLLQKMSKPNMSKLKKTKSKIRTEKENKEKLMLSKYVKNNVTPLYEAVTKKSLKRNSSSQKSWKRTPYGQYKLREQQLTNVWLNDPTF